MITKYQAKKLKKLIQDYADCQEIDSWKGGGDPDDYEIKAENLKKAREKLYAFIKSITEDL